MASLAPATLLYISAALIPGGAFLVRTGVRRLRRRWMMANLPTSKVRSVAMGLAELKGKAKPANEAQVSPIRGISCVWDRVEVVKEWSDSRGNRHEKRLIKRERRVPFYLEDDTGRILILPDRAEISGVSSCEAYAAAGATLPDDIARFCDMNGVPWRVVGNAAYRIREWVVIADADVYVLGGVGKAHNPMAARKERILKKLRAWKADPKAREAIDENRNGIIQQDEWMKAKTRARDEVMKEDLVSGAPVVPLVVRKPKMGFFLIASGTEADAVKRHGTPGWALAGGFIILIAGIILIPDLETIGRGEWLRAAGLAVLVSVVSLGGLNFRFRR